MSVVLALVFMAVTAAGLISILVPLKFLGIRSRGRGFLVALAGFVALVVVAVQMPPDSGQSTQSAWRVEPAATQSSQTRSAPPSPTEQLASVMPDAQRAVVNQVQTGRAQYAAGANEMAKGAARPARAGALCAAMGRSLEARNWVGRIVTLSSNSDGKGVLAIEIGPEVLVKTWNNALSDVMHRTLLEPGSSVFNTAVNMQRGQLVRFSGVFFSSDTDCLHESSLSIAGSMRNPEFIMRFTQLSAL